MNIITGTLSPAEGSATTMLIIHGFSRVGKFLTVTGRMTESL
jgi:hypothetical protein